MRNSLGLKLLLVYIAAATLVGPAWTAILGHTPTVLLFTVVSVIMGWLCGQLDSPRPAPPAARYLDLCPLCGDHDMSSACHPENRL